MPPARLARAPALGKTPWNTATHRRARAGRKPARVARLRERARSAAAAQAIWINIRVAGNCGGIIGRFENEP
jgi:hypothetical protein